MSLMPLLVEAINARKKRALRLAAIGLPAPQFEAFRAAFLDEFGRSGLERDLEQIVAEHERRNGNGTGRPTHAGKEVPHA